MTKGEGAVIISLDFELNWGIHDVYSKKYYGDNIMGARIAIPKMLELFRQYDIHATWATVGMLCFSTRKELEQHFPALLPTYIDQNFSPYGKMANVGENEATDPYHFGLSLLNQIAGTPHQEIGTHTFSHFYCLENGQTKEQFKADLLASLSIPGFEKNVISSLVFPRNQVNQTYLKMCKDLGIESYRGNEESWIYRASGYKDRGVARRLVRLVDHYVNLTGHHTYKPVVSIHDEPVNLKASRFLRPYHPKSKRFEPLRLKRIKQGIEHAAIHGEIYHLWWHPHNFGAHLKENLSFLQHILEQIDTMRVSYGMQSLSMGEAADRIRSLKRGDVNFEY